LQFDKCSIYGYNSHVKKASIATAKNTLSRLIKDVRRGETVLILDRDNPVARLEPVSGDPNLSAARMSELVKRGIVAPPKRPLDASAFLKRPLPPLEPGASGIRALLEEREGGR
jgi:antitoxin (DNA-binding transcriptional repressor) of toxin-antitoxin stability system